MVLVMLFVISVGSFPATRSVNHFIVPDYWLIILFAKIRYKPSFYPNDLAHKMTDGQASLWGGNVLAVLSTVSECRALITFVDVTEDLKGIVMQAFIR